MEAFTDLQDFVASLERPRRVLLLVPAGRAVDAAIDSLLPLLSRGDVLVDMGNEWYERTEERHKRVCAAGIHYVGCGLSGGGEGARRGPCLMPGGPPEAWQLLQPLLEVCAPHARNPSPSPSGDRARGVAGRAVRTRHLVRVATRVCAPLHCTLPTGAASRASPVRWPILRALAHPQPLRAARTSAEHRCACRRSTIGKRRRKLPMRSSHRPRRLGALCEDGP